MGEQQEIKWIGGVSAGQDVTIRLVRNVDTEETLAVVKVHSTVLSTYSKYFNTCLSERWRNLKSSPESSRKLNFSLESKANVGCYFHCFARMYSPLLKSDVSDVKYGLELLKVASQILFHELMDSTLLYLSSTFWSKEDEIRIREYSSSPDFPRNHAKDLVTRLGLDILDKSDLEDRQKQFWGVMQQIVRTAVNPEDSVYSESPDRVIVAELLQSFGPATPHKFVREVINLVTNQAKGMLVNFEKDRDNFGTVDYQWTFRNKMMAICWILKALLTAKLAEELVACFVHMDGIPSALYKSYGAVISFRPKETVSDYADILAEVVFLMYEEVVAGHLVLRTPERVALLVNWHPLLKKVYRHVAPAKRPVEGEPELKLETKLKLVTAQLFSTLPLKEQMEFVKLRKNLNDFISNYTSFISTLSEQLAGRGIG